MRKTGPWPCATLAVLLLACPGAASADLTYKGAQMHPWGLGAGRDPADNIRELDALRTAGANTVRMDMPWAEVEPFRDQIDADFQRRTDEFIAAANARGIKPILNIAATPCWASSDPRKGGCERHEDRFDGFQHAPADPADLGEVAAYLARRYSSGGYELAALELWNEPNWCSLQLPGDSPGCPPPPGVDPASEEKAATYAAMVRASYPRIKAVAPALPVLVGALGDNEPLPFLRALYRYGIDGRYDAISIHPYNRRWPPSSDGAEEGRPLGEVFRSYVAEVRQTMEENEAVFFHKPIWLTELGWSTCPLGDLRYSGYCVNEERQAAFLAQALEQVRSDWSFVEAAIVYEVRDSAVEDPLQAGFGLLRDDFSPKPSFDAVRRAFGAPDPLGWSFVAR